MPNVFDICNVFLLLQAVEASWDMFLNQARDDTKKVLVIVSDKKSDNTDKELKDAVKMLEEDQITIVPVALGNEADTSQFSKMTDDEDNLVVANTTDDTSEIKDKIVEAVFKGALMFSCVLIHGNVFGYLFDPFCTDVKYHQCGIVPHSN